jgi:FMN phosphatase YigB (HAD superfamily)
VSLTRVDAVTFDVGNTLLGHPDGESIRVERRALKQWLQSHGVVEKERLRGVLAAAGRAWSDADVGIPRVATKAAADSIVDSLGLQVTGGERARLRGLMADIYRERPRGAAEGAADALRRLKDHGIELGIVSNRGASPGRLVMRQLEANGLAGFFDPAAIIWSDEVGFSKPDPRIYLSSYARSGSHQSEPSTLATRRSRTSMGRVGWGWPRSATPVFKTTTKTAPKQTRSSSTTASLLQPSA